MRKQLILALLLCGLFATGYAQSRSFTVAAGPLLSFPTGSSKSAFAMKTGIGVEGMGQYQLTGKSALLVQTNWATYGARDPDWFYQRKRLSIFSLAAGYRYTIVASGFFGNLLTGFDKSSAFPSSSLIFRVGGGKRFLLAKERYIDASVDYTFGDTHERLNLKALISLFQKR